MLTTHYAPGEVTPEQLEEYRLAYEAARQKEEEMTRRLRAAYCAYADALRECREADSVYGWAKQRMILDPQP
jgi:uncharacterized membrane protein